jgi:hypothetical protein
VTEGCIQRVLNRSGMQDAKTVTTFLYDAMMKRQNETIKEDKHRKTLYQQIVGSLLWSAVTGVLQIVRWVVWCRAIT